MKYSNDPRHNSRRLVLSVIYGALSKTPELGISPAIEPTEEEIANHARSLNIHKYNHELLKNLLDIVGKNYDDIVIAVNKTESKWKFDDSLLIDRCILLYGTAEILSTDTPSKVIIDEAIELAKEFSLPESTKFINGVLANIVSNNEKLK